MYFKENRCDREIYDTMQKDVSCNIDAVYGGWWVYDFLINDKNVTLLDFGLFL